MSLVIKTEPATHDVARVIQMLKTAAMSEFRMQPRRGKLEELEHVDDPTIGLSISYGCRAVRVRFMQGRQWVSWLDLPATQLNGNDWAVFRGACAGYLGVTP